MLNKDNLLIEYNHFKDKAYEAYFKNKFNISLHYIQYCSYIAWQFPILYNFVDDDLENLLDKISFKLSKDIKKPNDQDLNDKKIILYAGQLIDSGALTEQYLFYLVKNEYQVLVIVPDKRNVKLAPNTLAFIEGNEFIQLYIPTEKSLANKIRSIIYKIDEFKPSRSFLHFLPNDVVGYCVFTGFDTIKRYYIVHNDHTYWLGKNCSDFFIEFRKFGYQVSTQRRGISPEKIFIIPYYPINNKITFKGLPFSSSGMVVGISGANLYKYFVDPELHYFKAIKTLLYLNNNFIFCLCGWGDGIGKIIQLFNEEPIKNRFYFLGKRQDFYELVGKCDILFESYPLKGGLTVLFATEQNIPVIGVSNFKNASGAIQDLLEIEDYIEPKNMDEFIHKAHKLISDTNNRVEHVNRFKKKSV